ncbi:MAG: double-strand break repair helicase AddA [Alphaproteobacteria bacterium]|nr:double-strand break repair helicase AddA [Alphaproteobacteria bacterium]
MSSDSLSAADPRRSAWVSAHAGSGKTYTLANRVTRLLLDGAAPERILCLTYTKSAAAEMQGRLFEQLGSWAMLPDAQLTARIAEIGGAADDLPRARRLFALALETPGGLKIQTIHSFCQYLLARFPLEAGIAPGFTVLDDQTARELIGQARTRVLERAGSGEAALAAAAAHLVTQTSEQRLNDILDAALGNDRGKLERFFAELPDDAGAFTRAVRQAHGARERDTVERIAAEFAALIDAEERELRSIVAWLAGGKSTDVKRAEALTRALAHETAFDRFAAFGKAFLTKEGSLQKRMATKELADAQPALHTALEAWGARVVAAEERRRAAHAASLAEAALTLADAVRKVYAEEKRFRGALDYDDLIAESLKLLKKREAAAWVLYKLDGGLDHILIDEAQDTSPEQWQIVRALSEEFFAGAGARADGRPRTIFAVGDEKQSIFSFQGADPVQFDINRRHFAGRAPGEGFVDVQLATSRRSAPEILSFVDTVFADAEAREGLTSAEGPIAHTPHRVKAKGRVEFWPALKPDAREDADPWRPVDVAAEDSPVRRLAERIARQIKSWTDGRTRLPGHDAPIKPGDIMILMPRRQPFASEIIRQLKERGIPVAGADRIRLTEQIAVMDLMALGRFALLPEDNLNLAALLRSPLCELSEDELYALCAERKGTLWRELEQREGESAAFGFAYAFLKEMRARADYAPPYEFYAAALIAHGMKARLLARLGAEAGDAIDEFLSLALAFEAQNTPGLQAFLHWLEQGEAEIKRDMERGRNEVRVMTVHGAKGLEADIVFLPDTTTLPEAPGKRGDLLYTEDGIVFPVSKAMAPARVEAAKAAAEAEALKEHRRLFYVALTRARERLIVCGFENRRGVRPGSWYALAERAATEIGTPEATGDEIIHALGEGGLETGGTAKPHPAATRALPDWARRPPPPQTVSLRIINPSDAAGIEDQPPALSPLDGRGAARFRRGLLVHALLARLPEVPAGERAAVAHKFLSLRNVPPETAAALVAETLAVLAHPEFAPAFGPDARAELPILADLPELGTGARINGRIDRVAVTAEGVWALDFKTNRPPPSRVEDVPRLYLAQMALYRAALARIFPGRRIACALIWTENPSLMALPEALLEAETAAIRSRLDPAGGRS